MINKVTIVWTTRRRPRGPYDVPTAGQIISQRRASQSAPWRTAQLLGALRCRQRRQSVLASVIHRLVYRCWPRHTPQRVQVPATSITWCTSVRHIIQRIVYWCPLLHPPHGIHIGSRHVINRIVYGCSAARQGHCWSRYKCRERKCQTGQILPRGPHTVSVSAVRCVLQILGNKRCR
jgi:hypothetical protein